MTKFEEALADLEEMRLTYDGYPIPEAEEALEKARARVLELYRVAQEKAWNAGFDEASDDLGRAELMQEFDESTNPYTKDKR